MLACGGQSASPAQQGVASQQQAAQQQGAQDGQQALLGDKPLPVARLDIQTDHQQHRATARVDDRRQGADEEAVFIMHRTLGEGLAGAEAVQQRGRGLFENRARRRGQRIVRFEVFRTEDQLAVAQRQGIETAQPDGAGIGGQLLMQALIGGMIGIGSAERQGGDPFGIEGLGNGDDLAQ